MDFNWNIIGRVCGFLLVGIALSMLPSAGVSAFFGETEIMKAFGLTMLPAFLAGGLLVFACKPQGRRIRIRDGYLTVALCWLLASLIAAVPFRLSGQIPSLADAFFETCSGFSTTGASVLAKPEALSRGLLFWRSFTHWLGGMGILIFAVAILPGLGIGGQVIAKAETPGPTLDKLTPKISDTAKVLYLIYICFTLAEAILLMAGGLSPFDALIHTFGTVGTGGFSSYSDSAAHFGSAYAEWIIGIFMVLSGVSFNLYFSAVRHGFRQMVRDAEFRMYLIITGASSVLICWNLLASSVFSSAGTAFRAAFFQTASILSTTGYATADYDLWPGFSRMLLFCLMFIGGCSSSTGGGVKVIRILVAMKLIRRGIALRLHPNAVVSVRLGGRTVSSETVSTITSFLFLYLAIIFAGGLAVTLSGFDLITSFSAVIACLGNVGPGFEMVGPAMNYGFFPAPVKLLLSLLMLAGRLELFTILMLFTPRFWDASR